MKNSTVQYPTILNHPFIFTIHLCTTIPTLTVYVTSNTLHLPCQHEYFIKQITINVDQLLNRCPHNIH